MRTERVIAEPVTVYRNHIDGVPYYEQYDTPEEAMEGANLYFQQDHSLKEAVVFKYTRHPVGIRIKNKQYEKTIV